MAILNLDLTNFSISSDLQTQFAADSKPTAIPPAVTCYDSSGNDLLAIGTDEFGAMLFSDLTNGEYGDPSTGGYIRAFTAERLLVFLTQHYSGITGSPTFSASVIPLGRKCDLPCGGNTASEVNSNDASALAEAFLTARLNGWVTPL